MVLEKRPLEIGKEYFDDHPFLSNLISQSLKPYMVLKQGSMSISAANLEFTKVAGTLTHLRVTTTGSYKKVAVVSSNSNDNADTTTRHMRKIKVWGIDSNKIPRVEEISLAGATSQSSTNSFYELGDIYGSLYGSGGDDAAGAVQVAYVGKVTNEILQITSNTRMSISSRIPIPKSWRAKILGASVYPGDTATSSTSGVVVWPHYYDENDCKEEDSTFEKVLVMRDGAEFDHTQWPRIYGNDTTYGLLEFLGIRHVNTEVWNFKARVALWATHACSSNRRELVGDL